MDTVSIDLAVGVRNGVNVMPNRLGDLQKIADLLDRIPTSQGGTGDTPGIWSKDRITLIAEITPAIVTFQSTNNMRVADGVVDRGGGTLRLMNQLAGPAPLSAVVTMSDVNSFAWTVASPASFDGTAPLEPLTIAPALTRALVCVTGSSIRWFGVVIPLAASGGVAGGVPHIFFTPSPWQGGFQDNTYFEFTQWNRLWDKYTSAIGSQLVASGASQILVIPFYKNAQASDLGDFLTNWQDVVSAVVTAAIVNVDAYFLRDTYQFDQIFTSSFSNGIVTHQNFNTRAAGAGGMTTFGFNLDGQAAGSSWNPHPAVVYTNTPVSGSTNPVGTRWSVGGRLSKLRPGLPGKSDHNLCVFLLLHGLSLFG